MATSRNVRLVLSDVDGTLVNSKKVLTERAKSAVKALREKGILFAITSGRPPLGMKKLIQELELDTPIAAFNGGAFVNADLSPISQKLLPNEVALGVLNILEAAGVDVWIYRGEEWLIKNPQAAHVAKEQNTVQFSPKVVADLTQVISQVVKVVGVSDDHELLAKTAKQVQEKYSHVVSASLSQPYYFDVTHPEANKGAVVKFLSQKFSIPQEEIATLGDMPNDVEMFNKSGLSIAMGNADDEVKHSAKEVTDSLDNEGFAKAIERFVINTAADTAADARL